VPIIELADTSHHHAEIPSPNLDHSADPEKAAASGRIQIDDMAEQSKSVLRPDTNSPRDYVEIGAAFLVLVGILFALSRFDLLPQRLTISDEMSYGLVFAIGLVASVSSCMAVAGGLLVAVAAKYNQISGNLTSLQRLKPHLYFNAGRVVSYTILGGAIGALGATLTLSNEINGFLTIAASAVMILLGLQMLRLFPSLTRFMPTMPKALSHRIHDLAERDTSGSAFLLGGATFFLPCGFTQALQLYVLAKGSFYDRGLDDAGIFDRHPSGTLVFVRDVELRDGSIPAAVRDVCRCCCHRPRRREHSIRGGACQRRSGVGTDRRERKTNSGDWDIDPRRREANRGHAGVQLRIQPQSIHRHAGYSSRVAN
jgi:sulfite exporter TauE/SafE